MNKFEVAAEAALKDFQYRVNKQTLAKRQKVDKLKKCQEKSDGCKTKQFGMCSHKKLLPDLVCYECSLCSKVFLGPEFVLKHLIHEHSDEILKCHMVVKSGESCSSENVPTEIRPKRSPSKTKLQTLAKEVKELKQTVPNMQETLKYSMEEISQRMKSLENSQRASNENLAEISTEISVLMPKIESLGVAVNELNLNYSELQRNLKKDISDLKVVIVRYQSSASKELSESLRAQNAEIASIKQNIQETYNSIEKLIYSELEKHNNAIEMKISAIDQKQTQNVANLQRCVEMSLTSLKEQGDPRHVEAMFENHLQTYLNKIEKRAKSPNEKAPKIRVVKKQKTQQKQAVKTIDVSDILEETRKKTSENLNQDQIYFQVLDAVETKMNSMKFAPGIQRFSMEVYEQKAEVLAKESQNLAKKFRNFNQIYCQIEQRVDKAAKDLVAQKKEQLHGIADDAEFFAGYTRESSGFLVNDFNKKYDAPFGSGVYNFARNNDFGNVVFVQPAESLPESNKSAKGQKTCENVTKKVVFNSTVNEAGDCVNIKEFEAMHGGLEAYDKSSLSSGSSFFRDNYFEKNPHREDVLPQDGEQISDDLESKESLSSWNEEEDEDESSDEQNQ